MMTTRTGANFRIQILRYERTGLPAEVIEAVALDLPAPGPGEALVALRCAAIHYSDWGLINGTYGKARSLPAVAGREAVGEVVAMGPGVAGLKIGAVVRMPEEAGVWREAVVAKAAELFPIPPGVPTEQAAMAFINPPTAWQLLRGFVKLERGDWLAQNAGTSAVGVLVAQLSRHWGYQCLSVVRDAAAEKVLLAAGAAAVAAEDSGYEKNAAKWTGGAPIRLALNAVGGESVARLCRAVAPGGVVVTYGGVSAEPLRFPTRYLIFNDIQLRGFWLDHWLRAQPAAEVRAMMGEIFGLLREGVLAQPIAARYPLGEWRAALEHAFRAGKGGKVMLESQWRP